MQTLEKVKKCRVVQSVVIIGLVLILFGFYYDLSLDMSRMIKNERMKTSSDYPSDGKIKKILYWNKMFSNDTFYLGSGDIFKHCPGVSSKCWATRDRTLVNVEDFDALLFHGSELETATDILTHPRRMQQRYVFVNLESPANREIGVDAFDYGFFNLTMTYRSESDIFWPYAYILESKNGRIVYPRKAGFRRTSFDDATGEAIGSKVLEETNIWERKKWKKTKTAAWFVSNCESKSKREAYVDELSKHVDVDIFGFCSENPGCPRDQDCFRTVVEPNYYFYLAFENSMCQDYVTEKLYNALKFDVVPVVYGGANYTRFAPPNSYINALDFNSPKELAEYLKKLIQQPKEYEKYFKWKRRYEVVSPTERVLCDLCQYLHEANTTKFYSPLSAWYMGDKCPLQEKINNLPYLTKLDLTNP